MNLDNGIEGMVVNHEPLDDLKLKRLLLLFDKLHFTPPIDNLYFLEDNALAYEIIQIGKMAYLYSHNGFDVSEKSKDVHSPELPEGALQMCKILNFNTNGQNRLIFNMRAMVPYYNGDLFKCKEEELFDKFSLAIDKNSINILDYKTSQFYQKNSINLKAAYDNDVSDVNNYLSVKGLLKNTSSKSIDRFIPSPMLPTPGNLKIFKGSSYNSKNFPDFSKNNDLEIQYFSVIGKLTKKIALGNEYNLNPIFVNENMYNLYLNKIRNSKKCKDKNFLSEWDKNYQHSLNQIHNLLFNTSYYFVKDEVLANFSVRQILEYREQSFLELYNIRRSILQELENVKTLKLDTLDLKEIKDLIENKIMKDLLSYQQANSKLFHRMFKLTTNAVAGLSTLAVSYTQNLSPLLIAILSGAAPAVLNEATSFVKSLEDQKIKKFENTFAYYYNLEKYKI